LNQFPAVPGAFARQVRISLPTPACGDPFIATITGLADNLVSPFGIPVKIQSG
jgi:hypothetical protein